MASYQMCSECIYRDAGYGECEVYHMHVDADEIRGCKDYEEKSCGNCRYLGGVCDGPYGVGTNTCEEWELNE